MRTILAATFFLAATPTFAAEPFEGKWGTDPESCRVEPSLTLTSRTIDSPTVGCRQVAYRRAGDKWSAKAVQCYAEGEDGATSMTFDVLLRGGKLQIDWGKDGKSDRLVNCGK